MKITDTVQTADDIIALPERLVPPLDRRERAFRIALATAFLLHAALFIDLGRSVPKRTLGDRSGANDAIAVDIVTSADLKSLEAVATPPAGAPAPAVAPQPPPPEAKPEPEPEQKPEPEAAVPAPAAPAEPQPKEPPPKEPEQEKKEATLPDFESLLPDLATIPQPTEKAEKPPEDVKPAEKAPEAAKAAETPPAKKKQPQKQARVAPTPQDLSSAPPGRSAGASRPPGITRSGENDDFGRGVIRALRATMPPPRGIYGRVTIRIILNENGDIAEVQMLDKSGTSLDQSVVFAAKQSYFPLPPYKSTLADRTFMITYVYR